MKRYLFSETFIIARTVSPAYNVFQYTSKKELLMTKSGYKGNVQNALIFGSASAFLSQAIIS